MIARVKKFTLLGPATQWLLLQIWLLLAVTRLRLLLQGLSHFTSELTLHRTLPAIESVPERQLEQARELGRLVALAARYTPWQSQCLTQVLVLQRLLAQREIPGFFSLGVRRAGDHKTEILDAHAWLQCGQVIVNGASPDRSYTMLSTFSWDGRAGSKPSRNSPPGKFSARQS